MLPRNLEIYLPNYTPHAVEVAPGIEALALKYSEMAIETSLKGARTRARPHATRAVTPTAADF